MRRAFRTVGGAFAAFVLSAARLAPTIAQRGGAVDRGFMIGRWTDDGNCADAASFRHDGTFVAANGNQGLWHLEGDRLTMTGSSTLVLRVIRLGRNSVDIINPDGSRGHSTRCAGGESGGGRTIAVDYAYVVGRWTDNNDCSVAAAFLSNGQFQVANGSGGTWVLSGDRLTMTGSSTLTLQIVPIDRNTMNVVNPDGSLGRSTRC